MSLDRHYLGSRGDDKMVYEADKIVTGSACRIIMLE